MNGPGILLEDKPDDKGSLHMFIADGKPRFSLYAGTAGVSAEVTDAGPIVEVNGMMPEAVREQMQEAGLQSDFTRMAQLAGQRPSVSLGLTDAQPWLRLTDERGHVRTAVGACSLLAVHTGVEEKRPPSSLMLFNEKGKVIWSVP